MKVGVTSLSLVLFLAVASLPAQRFKTHKLPEKGLELKVPAFMEVVPTKPNDLYTLAKFSGKAEAKWGGHKGDYELTYYVFAMGRPNWGKTGPDGDEIPDELKGMPEKIRSASTLELYLMLQHLKNDLTENDKLFRRPLVDNKKRAYRIFEFVGSLGYDVRGFPLQSALIRAFVQEEGEMTFGLVAVGAVEPFVDLVNRTVKSIEREEIQAAAQAETATAGGEEDDFYADKALLGIEHRRKVRANLVPGWEAYDSDNYILVTNVQKQSVIDRMLTDLEIMRLAYLDRFPPIDDIEAVSTVRVCDGYDDYIRYAGRGAYGSGGYWAFAEEELVLFNPERKVPEAHEWLKKVDALGILYHEAMHQYFFYANGELSPGSWFGEGYGEYFGGAVVDRRKRAIRDVKTNKFRMDWIKQARKERAWPDLRAFLKIDRRRFYGTGSLQNYAFAWAFCYFLELEGEKKAGKRNDRWAAIPDDYLIHLRRITEEYKPDQSEDLPKGWLTQYESQIQEEAYEATFDGIDMAALEKAWIAEMKTWR